LSDGVPEPFLIRCVITLGQFPLKILAQISVNVFGDPVEHIVPISGHIRDVLFWNDERFHVFAQLS